MKQLLSFCESQRQRLLDRLGTLVALESPSTDTAAVDRCGAEVQRWLAAAGAAVDVVPSASAGNHIIGRFAGTSPPILLLGHIDTVWPVGTIAGMPFAFDGHRLHGPGIFDMKGGIALALTAIDALASSGRAARPAITVLLTTDEEIGSVTSRSIVEREALASRAVLVLEPPLPGGAAKTMRKGVGDFEVLVHGLAAHAGIEPEKGANAILELADRLIEIEHMQCPSLGTTLTVTLISGGTRSNVVPAEARATVDARVMSMAEARRVEAAMQGLCPSRPGTSIEVSGGFSRPPLERTPGVVRLLGIAQDVARELGFELGEGATGGGSDGNFAAALGVPTLDGLGAPGDGAHAAHEHVLVDELPRRAALLAGLIGRL
jgi:glutamate carboxypeptidase